VRSHLGEVISCERFDDYLQATIFNPLGMVDTGSSSRRRWRSVSPRCNTRDASKQLTLLGAQDHPTSRFRQWQQ
jgi:CubicO group peptidase (beta-lactamase class C family)